MMKLNTEIANDILAKNIKREHRTFSKYACLSQKAYRFNEEELPDRKNIRTPFFHDTDKIIHSLAYTRYIDKTQVFYLFENDNITHRVLHVQLVSKIARVIGRALSLNEDLIEAISLGHDLGHVPYGHNGEKMLNKLMLDNTNEYFCHNAQSVRALHYLEDLESGKNETSISKYLNEMSEDYTNNTTYPRVVCDFIAGMTDDYFNNEFKGFVIPHGFGYDITQKS